MEYDLKTPEQKAEVCNVVRFAINRSQLTQEHMDYVIAAVKALYEDRESIPNVRIVKATICRCAISTPSLRPIRTNNENSGERHGFPAARYIMHCTGAAGAVLC